MRPFQRIMLIADASMHLTPAFARAVRLGRSPGASLHIVLADHDASIDALSTLDDTSATLLREAWLGRRRDWLHEQAAMLGTSGLRVSVQAAWARPRREGILKLVDDYRPDLLVKDVLPRRLGWHLLRDCPNPVMLVNALAPGSPRRVIAAVDVSQAPPPDDDFNERIVEAASALAAQCEAELHLAYAFDVPSVTAGGLAATLIELLETLGESRRARFGRIAQAYRIPAERRHFLNGVPATALNPLLQDGQHDVLVLGAHQRKGIDRVLVGSTAEAMIEAAPCDVLVVKPTGVAPATHAPVSRTVT